METLLLWSLLFFLYDPGISLPVSINGETSPCDSNPCQNDGVCVTSDENFKCICSSPYIGTYCEKDPCQNLTCHNGGVCKVDEGNPPFCWCTNLFTGEHCDIIVPCIDYTCKNGASCVLKDEKPHCRCKDSFTGKFCDKEDETLSSTSLTVTTVTSNDLDSQRTDGIAIETKTTEGETTSEKSSNHGSRETCATFPCENGGTCFLYDGPKCICGEEYSGLHCEEKTDETSSEMELIEIGTTSESSSDNGTADPCNLFKCDNGGSCFLRPDPVCVCKKEYSGQHCEIILTTTSESITDTSTTMEVPTTASESVTITSTTTEGKVDLCTFVQCRNGGTCFSQNNSAKCVCNYGYSGQHCELIPTTNSESITNISTSTEVPTTATESITNTSTTTEVPTTATESIANTSTTTEGTVDPCSFVKCENGGSCFSEANSAKCVCKDGYSGYRCEITPITSSESITNTSTTTEVQTSPTGNMIDTSKPSTAPTEKLVDETTTALPSKPTGKVTDKNVTAETYTETTSDKGITHEGIFNKERDSHKIKMYSGGAAGVILVLVTVTGGLAFFYTKRKRQRRQNAFRNIDSSSVGSAESSDSTCHLA